MEDIKKNSFLCDEEFIAKVYSEKIDKQMTNLECKDYINNKLQTNYSESTLRGIAKYVNLGIEIQNEKVLSKARNENEEQEIDTSKLNYKNTIELNKDGSQTSDKLLKMSQEECKNPDFLLKAHGYSLKDWEIVSARNNIWNSYSKQDGIMTLYASKITVKPRVNDMSIEEIKEMFEDFDRKNETIKKIDYKNINGDLLFEFPLVDLHYGKKGYSFEIGKDTYSDNTKQDFFKVIYDYKERLKNKKISRIVFPVGNDFFNSDTVDNSTTKGTKQDNDMRWKELFKKGLYMLIQGIDILSEIAPIDLIYVEGNHDTMTTYHLFIALEAFYRKDGKVNVIDDVKSRQYYQWGKCLIGFSHGDKEGKRINGLMQKEQPKMWGDTLYREWHLAHLHHEMSKEDNGLIIRYLPSITGIDAWHYTSGYTMALQRCQAFIWDKEKGLQDILFSIV